MFGRRQNREKALQILYACDICGVFDERRAEDLFKDFYGDKLEHLQFGLSIVEGVLKNLLDIDAFLNFASINWKVDSMSVVDRNILRMGTYEICFLEDIPVKVSINEAIEIAKKYGTEESHVFVNGVLDRIATEVQRCKEMGEDVIIPYEFYSDRKKVNSG